MYVCMYVYINNQTTTIATMALWQLIHLGTRRNI